MNAKILPHTLDPRKFLGYSEHLSGMATTAKALRVALNEYSSRFDPFDDEGFQQIGDISTIDDALAALVTAVEKAEFECRWRWASLLKDEENQKESNDETND